MSPLATVETDKSVEDFINSIENESKRADAEILVKLIQEVTGVEPKVWGDNDIVGFGKYSYRRKGGKEDFEWFNMGFAPRKSNLTVYVSFDLSQDKATLDQLGKYKMGKGCLYINRLADVDLDVLKRIIQKSKDSHWL